MRHGFRPFGLPALLLALTLALTPGLPARAQEGHEGHNHGDEGPVASGPVSPRGVTETPAFQLAAVMVRDQLLVFLDHPDSNEPISDAAVEMTVNDRTVTLSPRGDGAYLAEGWRPRVGHNALMFFVESAGTADLLNVALDIPEPKEAAAPPAATSGGLRGKTALLVAVPAALLLGLLVSVAVTRATRRRRGGAADDLPGLGEPAQT